MNSMKTVELKGSILRDNDRDAEELRAELRENHVFALNVMSSPGSGKTSVIIQTISRLKDRYHIGVMEADIDGDVDAKAVEAAGVRAVQLHTGGMCHLDAQMTRQGLAALGCPVEEMVLEWKEDEHRTSARRLVGGGGYDLVILENVGNLVCPAEFDTGCTKNCVIYSVPEGDDKPQKYPLMFEKADVVLVSKMDAAPAFDFDLEKAAGWIRKRNPRCEIIPISVKTGEGIDTWCAWLTAAIHGAENWKGL